MPRKLRRSFIGLVLLAVGALALAPTAAASPAAAPQQISVERLCGDTGPGLLHCHALRRSDLKPVARAAVAAAAITPAGYAPADLQDAYNLPSATRGAGVTVAIVDAFDNPTAEADLAVYRAQWGLPACTTANGCFKKLNQRGVQGSYPRFDKGWAGEIALDVDMVSAACPLCKIVLVEADSNANANLYAAVDLAASLGVAAISNSYGGSESNREVNDDIHFYHPGIAITVSTGDWGYGFGVEYPAASQFVTAVGGTTLQRAGNARGWTERAWLGSGSGCSAFVTKPNWQHDGGCALRTVADVSAVADPATGVAVYDLNSGGWVIFGGTSASSPLIAGTYALAENAPGTLNAGSEPYLHPTALYDVTGGSNGSCGGSYLCSARLGYDGPTGLGTPNGIAAFLTAKPAYTRDEESAGSVLYSGSWATKNDGNLSGGSARYSSNSSTSATFIFFGTDVTVVGVKGPLLGKVKITVGSVATTLDLYSSSWQFEQPILMRQNLPNDWHTVTLAPTGQKNLLSGGTFVPVDAFDHR